MSAAVVSIVAAFLVSLAAWAWYGPAGMRALAGEWRRLLRACGELHAVFTEVAVEPWLACRKAEKRQQEDGE